MRILDYTNLERRVVEGVRGTLTAFDVTGDEAFGVGLRVVPPNAKVPKPGLPFARGRRIFFVLRGSGTISNGEYYEKIVAGKFVAMDDGELPNFATQEDELVLLEVRYNEQARMTPPMLAATLPMSVDARAPPRATSYDTVD